jgi:hypothetical protein
MTHQETIKALRERKRDDVAEKLANFKNRHGDLKGWDGFFRHLEPKLWKQLLLK